jgi:hypothetical protein
MHVSNDHDALIGISAVLMPRENLDMSILDLAAVLQGLVADRFEIIVVTCPARPAEGLADDLRVRAPGLPLRVIEGETLAVGGEAAAFDLIFVAAPDGEFDVRELNHLLEAIEKGADVAAGYRPRAADGIFRRLQRWGWKVKLDCAFELFRRVVWNDLALYARAGNLSCSDLLTNVRRLGYRVAEVPVSHRRPTIGARLPSASRAA